MWELVERRCPGCSCQKNKVILEAHLPPEHLVLTYACRQKPSKYYFRQVRCQNCSLLYSSPTFSEAKIWEFYCQHQGNDFLAEIAADNHLQILRKFFPLLERKEKVLELGPGAGKLLEKLSSDFEHRVGVGPEENIKHLTDMRLIPHSYDLIVSILTLEHVFNPSTILAQMVHLLHPKGILFFIFHNEQSIYHRCLGKFSPLYDLQHLQLFSNTALNEWCSQQRIEILHVKWLLDWYPLSYWSRLMSLPFFTQCSWRFPLFGGNTFLVCKMATIPNGS